MADIQLDQNINGKRFARRCNDRGLVPCHRLPIDLVDAGDDEVIEHCVATGRLLVTLDRRLPEQNVQRLSRPFAGVLILAADDNSAQQMNEQTAKRVLDRFKDDFPRWHDVPWRNSIIYFQPSLIEVNHVEGHAVVRTGLIDRGSPGWQQALRALLERNAARNSVSNS